MAERVAAEAMLPRTGPGWGLHLTVRRRQRWWRLRLLQTTMPFLAMSGLGLTREVKARSPALLTLIPWLTPRWLAWLEQERNYPPANTPGPAARLPRADANAPGQQPASVTFPVPPQAAVIAPDPPPANTYIHIHGLSATGRSGSRSATGSLETGGALPPLALSMALRQTGGALPPLALSPALRRTGAGAPDRMRHVITGKTLPSALPVPVKAAAGAHLGQTGKETAGTGRADGTYPAPLTDNLPAPAAGWQTVSGAGVRAEPPVREEPPFAAGLPAGSMPARRLVTTAPGPGLKRAEFLPWGLTKAASTPGKPLLPEQKLSDGREFSAPGPVPISGLHLVLDTVRHTVRREVAAAISQREDELQARDPGRMKEVLMKEIEQKTAASLVSDNLVRQLMGKMRRLAEEERFRLGRLR